MNFFERYLSEMPGWTLFVWLPSIPLIPYALAIYGAWAFDWWKAWKDKEEIRRVREAYRQSLIGNNKR